MLDSLLRPKSIAVVGASRRAGSIGNGMLKHLVGSSFTGPVYPVNPTADSVNSVPSFPSIGALPTVPDLAVIVVPKQLVLGVVRECVATGVKGIVVITAGFREVGGEGIALLFGFIGRRAFEMTDRDRSGRIGPLVAAAVFAGTGADAAQYAWEDVALQVDLVGRIRIAVGNVLDVERHIGLGRTGRLAGDILGYDGLVRVANTSHANTALLAEGLCGIEGVDRLYDGPFFHEVALKLDRPVAPLLTALADRDILGGFDLTSSVGTNALLVCATETKTEADIEAYVAAFADVMAADSA